MSSQIQKNRIYRNYRNEDFNNYNNKNHQATLTIDDKQFCTPNKQLNFPQTHINQNKSQSIDVVRNNRFDKTIKSSVNRAQTVYTAKNALKDNQNKEKKKKSQIEEFQQKVLMGGAKQYQIKDSFNHIVINYAPNYNNNGVSPKNNQQNKKCLPQNIKSDSLDELKSNNLSYQNVDTTNRLTNLANSDVTLKQVGLNQNFPILKKLHRPLKQILQKNSQNTSLNSLQDISPDYLQQNLSEMTKNAPKIFQSTSVPPQNKRYTTLQPNKKGKKSKHILAQTLDSIEYQSLKYQSSLEYQSLRQQNSQVHSPIDSRPHYQKAEKYLSKQFQAQLQNINMQRQTIFQSFYKFQKKMTHINSVSSQLQSQDNYTIQPQTQSSNSQSIYHKSVQNNQPNLHPIQIKFNNQKVLEKVKSCFIQFKKQWEVQNSNTSTRKNRWQDRQFRTKNQKTHDILDGVSEEEESCKISLQKTFRSQLNKRDQIVYKSGIGMLHRFTKRQFEAKFIRILKEIVLEEY